MQGLRQFCIVLLTSLASTTGLAALDVSYQFQGRGNWSIDGVGSVTNPTGVVSAIVPLGSTVEVAYLYSSKILGQPATPEVSFEGIVYSDDDWENLGTNDFSLTAFRTDVTDHVSSLIGGGSDTPFSFSIDSELNSPQIDGEVLAIIYSNPAEEERTVAFLDGFSNSLGDQTMINFDTPLSESKLAEAEFEALLSLGIGFSYQPDNLDFLQVSEVRVNDTLLTNCAGGQDDGADAFFGGALITVGGIGDSPDGPDCDVVGTRQDDELYSIEDFLSPGDDAIAIKTVNPSRDDNIFFAGINITALATVNDAPVDPPTDNDNGGNSGGGGSGGDGGGDGDDSGGGNGGNDGGSGGDSSGGSGDGNDGSAGGIPGTIEPGTIPPYTEPGTIVSVPEPPIWPLLLVGSTVLFMLRNTRKGNPG